MKSISNNFKRTALLLSCMVSIITLSGISKKIQEVKLLENNIKSRFITKKISDLNLETVNQYLSEYPKTCFDDFENLTLQNDAIDIVYTEYDTFITTQINNLIHVYNLSNSHLQTVDITKSWKRNKVSFPINNYLWIDLKQQNLEPNIIKEVEMILINFIDIYNLKTEGKLSLDYKIQDTGLRNNCIINKLTYRSKFHNVSVSLIGPDMFGTYISDGKYIVRTYTNKAPVRNGILTSFYDKNRLHPITKEVKGHYGTDYGGEEGDPIYAVATGKIEELRKKRGNGNYIKINHGKKIKSQYLHMSKFRDGLKEGDRVMKNQLIGYVGQTGLASAPHVCYRFWYKGGQINHMTFKDFQKTTI